MKFTNILGKAVEVSGTTSTIENDEFYESADEYHLAFSIEEIKRFLIGHGGMWAVIRYNGEIIYGLSEHIYNNLNKIRVVDYYNIYFYNMSTKLVLSRSEMKQFNYNKLLLAYSNIGQIIKVVEKEDINNIQYPVIIASVSCSKDINVSNIFDMPQR